MLLVWARKMAEEAAEMAGGTNQEEVLADRLRTVLSEAHTATEQSNKRIEHTSINLQVRN